MYKLPININVVALSFAFVFLTFKLVGRLVALAHSAGATPRIKNDVISIINYSNQGDDAMAADPMTMAGYNYLVGPKYMKIKDGRIVDGITMDKVLRSPGKLLVNDNMELKDTGLSFALVLGKFWSYPLYDHDDDNKSSSSRAKAWKFVRHGLTAEEGGHERVFRVIETELAFLREYFHARYIFFYLNGFYWKLVTIVALPSMFWWFLSKTVKVDELHKLTKNGFGKFSFTIAANKIVISVIVALEIIQLAVFLSSRWLKVNLLCYYVNKMTSKNVGCLSRFFAEVLGFVFLGSWCTSNSAWWRNSWKREMSQYSLIESCTTLNDPTNYLRLQFNFIISIIGLPISQPGWKLSKAVKLSDEVKKAVVLCLQRNTTSPKLSNGAESLTRNGVMGKLSPWASILNNDAKTILVWHIATSVCELHTKISIDAQSTNSDNMKVATQLSKYCAYLLFTEPSLLPVPSLAVESLCGTTIQEAMRLFEQSAFGCGRKLTEAEKYNKLTNLDSASVAVDEEAGDKGINGETLLKTGAELGKELVKFDNEDERWRVLAEFWTEMILYLAPSNNNELDHAGKLSQGGEFITQLWALLIHAGIYNRDDIDRAF